MMANVIFQGDWVRRKSLRRIVAALVLAAVALDGFGREAGPAFRRIESHRRDGYAAELWEFYPDDFLAVKAYVLVPNGARPGKTPAVICMNEGRGSIQHLAGEPDPYGTINVDEGRKAYYAVKAGYVAVALALPGVANGCPDDIDSDDSRRRFLALLPESGWTEQKLVDLEVTRCVELLKANPLVDKAKISVMGFGDGAVIRNSAKAVPGLSVKETILPKCKCEPPRTKCAPPYLATGKRMMSERDYGPTRPDGRTEWTFAWAMSKRREALQPRVPPMLKDKATFEKWLDGRHADWAKRHGDMSKVPANLRVVKEERRKGYTLKTCEFMPFDDVLVVKAMVLVPDCAKPGRTPLVVCLPGSGSSLQGLAGEEDDPYWTRYPVRNRQAWWYCKMGMIGVGLDNMATANNAHDDVWYWKSQHKCRTFNGKFTVNGGVPFAGDTTYDATVIAAVINSLKTDPLVDRTKIAVSGLSLGAGVINAALTHPDVVACCYNDFAIYTAARPVAITRCTSDVVYGDVRGDGGNCFMACAPKYLLLNEGGAWKGVLENVQKAYELAGVPERLTIHHYDRYSYGPNRKWDEQDMVLARDYDYEDFYRHNNCDPYDHSFHPESALPWLCKIFYGKYEPSEEVVRELDRAGAERERSVFYKYGPDGRQNGRKAVGPLNRELTDDMLVPERPDGRTEKTATWAKMMFDKQNQPKK